MVAGATGMWAGALDVWDVAKRERGHEHGRVVADATGIWAGALDVWDVAKRGDPGGI